MAETAQFPTLSKAPSVAIEREFEDPAIRDEMENGLVSTRPRWSRVRRTWRVPYVGITPNDAQLVEDFIQQMRGGSGSFEFTMPDTGEAVTVRFARGGVPKISQLNTAHGIRYNCSFAIEEV